MLKRLIMVICMVKMFFSPKNYKGQRNPHFEAGLLDTKWGFRLKKKKMILIK